MSTKPIMMSCVEQLPTVSPVVAQGRTSLYTLQRVREKSVLYDTDIQIRQPQDIAKLAFESLSMDTLAAEIFVVISLDTKNHICGINIPFRGTLNASIVHPREVFQAALLNSAAAIIVLHNHPSGDATPSREDIEITRRLEEAGKIIGIELLDHIVVGDPDGRTPYVSMRERGLV